MMATHTLSVLVQNRPGVLARVSGLFARRGFNIDSLAVGETEDPAVSRMTIVVSVESKPLEQVTKQLNKLLSVLKVVELDPDDAVERELVLFKVSAEGELRARLREIAEIFRARVVDVTHETLTIEASGTPDKIEALRQLLEEHVIEMVRTGRIGLSRGARGMRRGRLRVARAAGA